MAVSEQIKAAGALQDDPALAVITTQPLPDCPDIFVSGKAPIIIAPCMWQIAAALNAAAQDQIDARDKNAAQQRVAKKQATQGKIDAQKIANTHTRWPLKNDIPTFYAETEKFRTSVSADSDTLNAITDRDRLVFYAVIAQAAAANTTDPIWITAENLLQYCGVKKIQKKGAIYTHGYRQENYRAIAESMRRLAQICVTLQHAAVLERKKPARKSKPTARQWLTTEGSIFAFMESKTKPATEYPITFRYQLAPWIQRFLSGPNRVMGYLPRQLLQYDLNGQRWESRLAEFFFWEKTRNGGVATTKQITTILDRESLICANYTDRHYPQKTIDSFERAMNALQTDGIIAHWQYEGALDSHKDLSARNRLKNWLGWRVNVAFKRDE